MVATFSGVTRQCVLWMTLLSSITVSAQPVTTHERRVGVWVLAAVPSDVALADGLAEVLIAAVAEQDTTSRILGKEEIQSTQGLDDASALECIVSASCVGNLGVRLNLHQLVTITIGRTDGGFSYQLSRFDRSAPTQPEPQHGEVIGDESALIREVRRLYLATATHDFAQLSLRVTPNAAVVVLDGEAIPSTGAMVRPGEHVLQISASGFLGRERRFVAERFGQTLLDIELEAVQVTIPRRGPTWLIAMGTSIAVIGTSLAIAYGMRSQSAIESGSMTETLRMLDTHEQEALIANSSIGAAIFGAVLCLGGLAWRWAEP